MNMQFGLSPKPAYPGASITMHFLPHKPSAEHPRQEVRLETEDDQFEEYITSTKGRIHSGPSIVYVDWYPSGTDVILTDIDQKGTNAKTQ